MGSAAFILGEYASQSAVDPVDETEEQPMGTRRFVIKEQRICRRLVFDENEPTKIRYAVVENLLHGTSMNVHATQFVICGGTVLGAQLLYASNIRPEALGRFENFAFNKTFQRKNFPNMHFFKQNFMFSVNRRFFRNLAQKGFKTVRT